MIAAAVAGAAVALTRGPVTESVTPRSAIISFRTAAREHAFVTLQNGARIDGGNGVDHVVRLTRLTPGMHYTYTVGADSAVLAKGTFRAAPARATRFTFAVVGDFGSGNEHEAAVASMIESWHPDFVQTVGDNAYPLGSRELLDPVIFGPYAAVMRQSAWFPALGNHDVKANGGKPELEAFHSLGSERWYRYTWGNTAVVVLDSDVSVGPRLAAAALRPQRPGAALPASASPRGTTRPGSHRAAASHPGFAATSCRWWRSMASRWCSKATCTPMPEAARTTGCCTWPWARGEPSSNTTPAN